MRWIIYGKRSMYAERIVGVEPGVWLGVATFDMEHKAHEWLAKWRHEYAEYDGWMIDVYMP